MGRFYVREGFRHRGYAGSLVRTVVEHARHHGDVLLTGANPQGEFVYLQARFVIYGFERDASRAEGVSQDNTLMALRLAGR